MPMLEPVSDVATVATKEKRIARASMSKASCLLFAIVILMCFSSDFYVYFFEKYIFDIEACLVKFVMFFGVPVTTAMMAVKEFLYSGMIFVFVEMIMTLVTLVFPAMLFSKLTHITPKECFNLSGKCIKGMFFVFCAVQLVTIAVSYSSNGIYDFLVPPVSGIYDGSFTASLPSIPLLVMEVFSTAILIPIVEEYVFRGVFLSYLSRYSVPFGIIASSLIFGIAHSHPVQSVYAFVFGLISAYTVVATGNMKTGILLHALNNFSMIVFGYLPLFVGMEITNLIYVLYLAVIIAFAFVGLSKIVLHGCVDDVLCKVKGEEKENSRQFGMAELFVLPIVAYVFLYAIRFVLQVI